MSPIGKTPIITGITLVIAGAAWELGLKNLPLGKLPGDIAIERPQLRIYFPFATSILISVLLSVIVAVIRHFHQR